MIQRYPMEWDNCHYRLYVKLEDGTEHMEDFKKKEKLEEKLNAVFEREDLSLVEVYEIKGRLLDRWE